FKFSTQTLSVVMICSILLYLVSIQLLYFASLRLDIVYKNPDSLWFEIERGMAGSLIVAPIVTATVCVFSLIRFMENHKYV
ncbi:Hypothetical predicted protein, partial [Paramuricea clavata]